MDIVAKKTNKTRGQAFIVFKDTPSATNALRQMQGFPFYDKPMRIAYAKGKSDAVAKADGSFVPRVKKTNQKRKATADPEDAPAPKRVPVEVAEGAPGMAPVVAPRPAVATVEPPNKILFVQNLPPACNEMMLQMLFQQFPGFKEVRMVPGKPGIAFVEFDNLVQSGVALNGLQDFRMTPTNKMAISYAKK